MHAGAGPRCSPPLPRPSCPSSTRAGTHIGDVTRGLSSSRGHGNCHVSDGNGLRLLCRWDGQLLAQALASTLREEVGWASSPAQRARRGLPAAAMPGMPRCRSRHNFGHCAGSCSVGSSGRPSDSPIPAAPPPRSGSPQPHRAHFPGEQSMASPGGEPPPQPPSPESGGLGRRSWIASACCLPPGVTESWPPPAAGVPGIAEQRRRSTGACCRPHPITHVTTPPTYLFPMAGGSGRGVCGLARHVPPPACCVLNLAVLSTLAAAPVHDSSAVRAPECLGVAALAFDAQQQPFSFLSRNRAGALVAVLRPMSWPWSAGARVRGWRMPAGTPVPHPSNEQGCSWDRAQRTNWPKFQSPETICTADGAAGGPTGTLFRALRCWHERRAF